MSESELTAKALRALAVTTGVAESEIMGQRRMDEVVLPRHLLIYIMRFHIGLGVHETARVLGKAPSTVCASLERAEFLLRYDKKAKRIYGMAVDMMVGVQP